MLRHSAVTPGRFICATCLLVLVLAVLVGPLIWQASPTAHQPHATLRGPSLAHPFGTDQFGRDMLARLLAGARWTLAGALLVSAGISLIGLVVGALAATLGRGVDLVLGRVMEAAMALPGLVTALAITALLGPSFRNLLLAMTLSGWPWYARVYRGVILAERSRLYLDGARVAGASPARLMLRHVLPNIAGSVIVLSTANIGSVILSLSALSFLGLGVQPPDPEWGTMINESRLYFQSRPWQMFAPGLCITFTVLVINLAGDSLRDMLDPRLRNSI